MQVVQHGIGRHIEYEAGPGNLQKRTDATDCTGAGLKSSVIPLVWNRDRQARQYRYDGSGVVPAELRLQAGV